MIVNQGRTQKMFTRLHHTTSVWDGPTYKVLLFTSADADGVPIGHIAYRTARTKRWPTRNDVWHATVATGSLTRARWWSPLDRTEIAEAFLLGMWLAQDPDEEHPTRTIGVTAKQAGPAPTAREQQSQSPDDHVIQRDRAGR
jgi:hypothetical protein